jgi:hypothetical protein
MSGFSSLEWESAARVDYRGGFSRGLCGGCRGRGIRALDHPDRLYEKHPRS